MRSIVKAATITLVSCCIALAQSADKPKVAFYFSGAEPKAGVFKPLGGEITKALVRSGKYIAVDRTETVQALITQEHHRQRSGDVDESQISAFGKQWGVKYVIAIEINRAMSNNYYIEAKMVDVEKASIEKMGTATTRLETQADLDEAARQIINDLLGLKLKRVKRRASSANTSNKAVAKKPETLGEVITSNIAFTGVGPRAAFLIFTAPGKDNNVDVGHPGIEWLGVVFNFLIVETIGLNAEVNALSFFGVSSDPMSGEVDSYGLIPMGILNIPITVAYSITSSSLISPYFEAGIQCEVLGPGESSYEKYDYSLNNLQVGAIAGAGFKIRLTDEWALNTGYRFIYGLRDYFEKYPGALHRHSIGACLLYIPRSARG